MHATRRLRQRELLELNLLLHATRAMNAALDLPHVLTEISRSAAALLRAESVVGTMGPPWAKASRPGGRAAQPLFEMLEDLLFHTNVQPRRYYIETFANGAATYALYFASKKAALMSNIVPDD